MSVPIKGFLLGCGVGMGAMFLAAPPNTPAIAKGASHSAPLATIPPSSDLNPQVIIRSRVEGKKIAPNVETPQSPDGMIEVLAKLARSEARVCRLRERKTELTAKVMESMWALRKALEEPGSTPYGSFLESSVGRGANEKELTNIWHILNDIPVILADSEALWLLDQVRFRVDGVVPVEDIVAFLGPARVVDEVSFVKLEELRLFFEDEEWEVLFPANLFEPKE